MSTSWEITVQWWGRWFCCQEYTLSDLQGHLLNAWRITDFLTNSEIAQTTEERATWTGSQSLIKKEVFLHEIGYHQTALIRSSIFLILLRISLRLIFFFVINAMWVLCFHNSRKSFILHKFAQVSIIPLFLQKCLKNIVDFFLRTKCIQCLVKYCFSDIAYAVNLHVMLPLSIFAQQVMSRAI